ncbi:MAG TPA: V-type ATP synthase subunit F [Gemmatimonadaceae bacterium]|nr:V-type ATP synthase subunit F [Gemmatimonadaceae bacterium]
MMRGDLRVVARPELAAGFRLAGLRVEEVATPAEGAARIEALAARPDAGILLVEEELLRALPRAVREALARRQTPIIVPVPRPSWAERPAAAEAYILEILQRAIGYRVRLQ